MKTLICTPMSGGQAYSAYFSSLLSETFNHPDRLAEQEKYQFAWHHLDGYSGLGKDRSIQASYALRHGFDKVLFIDADQSWKWPQIKALLDSSNAIVGGVIALKEYPLQLNFTPRLDDSPLFQEQTGPDKIDTVVGVKGLIKLKEKYQSSEVRVQLIGTGMLCIDVKVLDKMTEYCDMFFFTDRLSAECKDVKCWNFFPTGVVNEKYYGEDGGFCLMAQRAGFEPYVNIDVLIPHIGKHTFIIGNHLSNIFGEDAFKHI